MRWYYGTCIFLHFLVYKTHLITSHLISSHLMMYATDEFKLFDHGAGA